MSKKETRQKQVRKRRFDYKTWGLVGCAVVALVIVVVAIVKLGQVEKIESSYFHTSEGKIVETMDRDMAALEEGEYEPFITHIVYYHDGKKVTGARVYYEYLTPEEAKVAVDEISLGDFAESKNVNGRFVVLQVKRDQYDGMTVAELEKNVEMLKDIEALVFDYDENTIKQYGSIVVEPYEDYAE